MSELPHDVARCHGVRDRGAVWHIDCRVCARRLAEKTCSEREYYMMPIAKIGERCEQFIPSL